MTLQQMNQIFEDTAYVRMGGSDEELRCAKYLQEQVAKLGLKAEIEDFEVDMADIMKGMSILNTLSAYDVGQSVVIENGLVLGIECVEGTDSLIKRVKDIKKTSNRGVLVKTAKITQDMRVDIPTVGIDTIKNAYLAGLSGLAVGKDKCIILNKDEIECFANEHNMFFCEISCE